MALTSEGKERLDRFVARKVPEHSRTRVVQAIREGCVRVDGETVTKPSFELRAGQRVEVERVPEPPPHDLTPAAIPLDVRYEDEHLLVVNKPRGMASHPAPGLGPSTLVNALLARSHSLSSEGGDWRPGIVHRLDKDTTGLMLVAKTDSAHRALAAQIKEKSAVRVYVAVVFRALEHERTTIAKPLGRHPGVPSLMAVKQGGKEAVTHIRTLTKESGRSLVACRLETGRTHQIRVHLASVGCPVRGDKQYAKKPWNEGPMQLHAALLCFSHPVSGERVTVYAEPPLDFEMRAKVVREELESWR